jgi:hypothetical protein
VLLAEGSLELAAKDLDSLRIDKMFSYLNHLVSVQILPVTAEKQAVN